MDFEGNFKKLSEFDVAPILSLLQTLPLETWLTHSDRQHRFKIHSKTQYIPLIFDDDFRYTQPSEHKIYSDFRALLNPIFTFLNHHFNQQGFVLRLLFTSLPPNSEIPEHRDKGVSLTYVHRLHLPIQTNRHVFFTIGDETCHLRAGELWEINNCRKHRVINTGNESRIHLIMDWVTPTLARAYLEDIARTKLIPVFHS